VKHRRLFTPVVPDLSGSAVLLGSLYYLGRGSKGVILLSFYSFVSGIDKAAL